MDRCVNCGIATGRSNTLRRIVLEDEATLSIFRAWVTSCPVSNEDFVCVACWNLSQQVLSGQLPADVRRVGHSRVCLRCGRSLAGQRVTHHLHTDTPRERAIYNVIAEWIIPRTVNAGSYICHSCWILADRAAVHMTSGPSTSTQNSPQTQADPPLQEPSNSEITQNPSSQQGQTIVLPDYVRAIETESHCFIEGCQRVERYRVPLETRKMLLNNFKYYVPQNNRLCDHHIVIESWDFWESLSNNYLKTFNAQQIQDMLKLKESQPLPVLNLENISQMEDHVVHTWIGLNKSQFHQLLSEVPQFSNINKASLVLGTYLMKLRTGDSNERLAILLNISRTTVENYLNQALNMFSEYFVPTHLGLNHLNREQIVQRNLAIPSALFGEFEGESRPIAIFDGTYCYIEKSANYLYQKRIYSLHKYQNLVKPFLIVCTDGHIIDVLGPYPAITSDSEIIKNEFSNSDSLMRQYFREGDAFILDRGFRDALPILNRCGYRTYVPASLEEGETQLSTIEANRSRAVTICRWVVEVVNGRFKRDFKIFRQDYFSKASKSLMRDFEVAAALLNRFHPTIVDRVDAGEIINQININMNRENSLANFVITNNYNRRRADFESINVENEDLNEFPQLTYDELILFSLGTYQIKQARSYFGEHTRGNNGYVIEVCREVSSSLQRDLSTSNNSWLLRGRIHSRHISRKTFFIYILVDSSRRGRESIVQYCCNCIVGRRTVGCCAHVMSVIWYLSWARYQDNINPPAQFLDDVLIIIEDEYKHLK